MTVILKGIFREIKNETTDTARDLHQMGDATLFGPYLKRERIS